MGELADRKELRFSVCRRIRWARLGESMIIAETVDVDEMTDKGRATGSPCLVVPSDDGQPISSRNRSIDEVVVSSGAP
jgi:hypothetical protein